MGGVSLNQVLPHDGYTCPWCPTTILVVDTQDDARRVMESHLDAHFAQPIGRPRVTAVPQATDPDDQSRPPAPREVPRLAGAA